MEKLIGTTQHTRDTRYENLRTPPRVILRLMKTVIEAAALLLGYGYERSIGLESR